LLAAVLSTALAASPGDPDFAKLLKDVKITMAEAIRKVLQEKEAEGATAVGAFLDEDKGVPQFIVYVAKGPRTFEIVVDARDGKIVDQGPDRDDESEKVTASKIALTAALETALKKAKGKAVSADLDMGVDKAPEIEVGVFDEGKLRRVLIDARTGDVTAVLEPPDHSELLKSVKISLPEALEKAANALGDVVPVSAFLENGKDGPVYSVFVAKGIQTWEVEVDGRDGKILKKDSDPEDESARLKGAKVTFPTAIESALKKLAGSAVSVDLDMNDDDQPEIEVRIFASGRVRAVLVNAATGEIISV
jgi:uncharacterized membrane protein YkoI